MLKVGLTVFKLGQVELHDGTLLCKLAVVVYNWYVCCLVVVCIWIPHS